MGVNEPKAKQSGVKTSQKQCKNKKKTGQILVNAESKSGQNGLKTSQKRAGIKNEKSFLVT